MTTAETLPERAAKGPTGRTYRLRFTGERPTTLNAERRAGRYERARTVARWRAAFGMLALEQRVPRLDRVTITAQPLASSRRWQQDAGACLPAAKAAIDGIVDAGVLPDDGPAHVLALTLVAPQVGDVDGLEIVVEEVA